MTQLQQVKGRARIYACGGAGINIGKKLERFRGNSEVGLADLDITYIDTSRSNLDETVQPDHCYLLEGLDGSGSVRRENHKPIVDNVRKILQQFPPQDINIVVSSGSGGSGSVFAPSLVSELIGKEQPTIAIIIGGTDAGIRIQNTLNTLKSYESISKLRSAPVIAAYFQNSKESPREKVDNAIMSIISAITTVFSRENTELDSRDLLNFLYYERATKFKPRLVHLTAQIGDVPHHMAEHVITVATVATVGTDTTLNFTPEYQCVGYLPAAVEKDIAQNSPIHLVIHSDTFSGVAEDLETRLKALGQFNDARLQTKTVLSEDDTPTEDGLVL